MARTAEFKYTKLTGKLSRLLRDARDFGRPPKVTPEWLTSVGCGSRDPNSIIRVLKFVRLLENDGSPTDLWDTIEAPSSSAKRIRFAAAVRAAYAALFHQYRDAYRKDDETLKTFFHGRQGLGPVAQVAALKTFRVLVQFGDFEASTQSSAHSVIEVPEFVASVVALGASARQLLAEYEVARGRIEVFEPIGKRLEALSLEHGVLFRESLRAARAGLFRASIVLAWSDFAEYLSRLISVNSGVQDDASASEDYQPRRDARLVNTGKTLRLYGETTRKTLEGLLNDRHQCAHPTPYDPGVRETEVFLTRLIGVMEDLQKRWPTSH
jgi:hypothetical protein